MDFHRHRNEQQPKQQKQGMMVVGMASVAFVPVSRLPPRQRQQSLATKNYHCRHRPKSSQMLNIVSNDDHNRRNIGWNKPFSPLYATPVIDPFVSSSSTTTTGTFLDSVGSIIVSDTAASDITMTTTTTTTSPPIEFEPILNVPAFGTFLFIAIVFGLLQYRTSQVEAIVQERNRTMKKLRTLKSQEVSGGGDNGRNNYSPPDPAVIQQALDDFERAVQSEERLRNIIPGVVRIVPPSAFDDSAEQEARRAARQFLGKDYDIGKAVDEDQSSSLSSSRGDGGGGVGRSLPPSAIAVLLLLFVSELALLIFLNQDPMASSSSSTTTMITSVASNFL